MRFVSLVVLALMLVILPSGVTSVKAQDNTVPENVLSRADNLPKQLDALNTKRRDALDKILAVERQIFDLQQTYAGLKEYVRGNFGEDNFKQVIKALENVKEGTDSPEDRSYLDSYRYDYSPQRIDLTLNNVKKAMNEEIRNTKRFYSIEGEIKVKEQELFDAKQTAAKIENEIDQVILAADEENEFRLIISLLFTGLVAFVIAGFYVMAYKNNVVANAFGGEKGIQFITLFLVVIAIILFGIMGVFGGKELSALLGALSGYILGRSTSGSSSSSTKTDTQPPEGGIRDAATETKAT